MFFCTHIALVTAVPFGYTLLKSPVKSDAPVTVETLVCINAVRIFNQRVNQWWQTKFILEEQTTEGPKPRAWCEALEHRMRRSGEGVPSPIWGSKFLKFLHVLVLFWHILSNFGWEAKRYSCPGIFCRGRDDRPSCPHDRRLWSQHAVILLI